MMTSKSRDWMVIRMLFSESMWNKVFIRKLLRLDPYSTGGMSKISSINKLNKPFSKQCPTMELDPKCSTKILNSGLRNSLKDVLLRCGKWGIHSFLKTLLATFVILISTARLRKMSTRLRSSMKIIYSSIRSSSSGAQILRRKLIISRTSSKSQVLQSTLNIWRRPSC